MPKQELQEKTTSIFGTAKNLTIEQLLIEGIRQNPGARAIASPGRLPLTYARLYEHMQNVRATLNAMGLGVGDRVAIVLPKGPEMAVSFLAVAICATSAPLNPAYSAAEFDFYLGDLNAKALIVQSGIDSIAREVAAARHIPIIELVPNLKAEAGIFQLVGETNLPAVEGTQSRNEDIALVLHTSGTTARPKIVPLTQANLYASAQNIKKALALQPSDRCLNVMPLFHIHGLSTVFSSLAAGGSVVCTPNFDAAKFFEWMQQFHPSWYTAVPTIHQAILAEVEAHHNIIKQYPLRFIRSASSALPPQVMQALEQAFNVPVIEAYGMTEASPQITSNPLPPQTRKLYSAGLAAGPEVAIMDEVGNLLAKGEPGEVVIRGSNVMLAYENNPVANQNSFTKGWFRTGDQGYLDNEGYLFLTGRLKEQINRGGEKIAPREIDDVLLDHPAVDQAVAFAVPHPTLGEDLAAAIVLRPNTTVTEQEIREFVATKLAGFKVPNQIIFIPEIPKGSTGKLQRIGLAQKLKEQLQAKFLAPRTEIEKRLAAIWTQLLNLKEVGIYDNFFALGGDSLLAVRLFAQIEEKFHKNLPLSTLINAPTIEQLAQIVSSNSQSIQSSWSSLVALQPKGDQPPFFCIHGLGGEVLIFRELAMKLGTDRPFYGLQPIGLDGKQPLHTRIEDMAAEYIQQIQTIQPQGPYFLGGYSFGGIVAFEMAQQLRSQGEEIALLAMFDSFVPGSDRRLPLIERIAEHYQNLVNIGPSYLWQRVGVWNNLLKENFHKGKYHLKHKSQRYLNLSQNYLRHVSQQLSQTDPHIEIINVNTQASREYSFPTYPGRVVLLRTEDQNRFDATGIKFDPLLGWGEIVTGSLEMENIPGSHFTLFNEPYVEVVAEKLQAWLNKAQSEVLEASGNISNSENTSYTNSLTKHW
ncbi:alpha/beta fold hydrolase [Calothrix sp. NIES-2098]|uniref:alpha/beta fold hydrolase n=1 Tax=Calothrix sp. NIES-2098 TaxID=1954171 RepID=UPI000B6211E1|nr:AMP-binding enzyme domain protein [Calothrix sp. NIES-2098]